jgi:hypothetical protein
MAAARNRGEEGGLWADLLPGLSGNAVLWAMQSGFQSDLHASSAALILATTGPACSCSSILLLSSFLIGTFSFFLPLYITFILFRQPFLPPFSGARLCFPRQICSRSLKMKDILKCIRLVLIVKALDLPSPRHV